MRAITVRQPHASAILNGSKDVENRGFSTSNGDLLICAGKTIETGGENLPLGVALCIVRVVGIIAEIDGETVCVSDEISDDDIETQSYNPGSVGWLLRDIRPVEQFPVRGMPGIFRVNDALIKVITNGPKL